MKIDILEAYVWTPESFWMSSSIFWSTGGLPEPPGELMGLNGPWWERGGGGQVGGARPPSPIRIGGGAFLLSFSLFLLLLLLLGKGGNLLLLGVGIPPLGAS